MTLKSHGIAVGDKFIAIVRKSCRSKDFLGEERAGQPVACGPQIADKVTQYKIASGKLTFYRHNFYLKRVENENAD